MTFHRWLTSPLLAALAATSLLPFVSAQDAKTSSSATEKPSRGEDGLLPIAGPGDAVVIKREAVAPIDPHKYRASLSLSPAHTVTLVAPYDGIVRSLTAKPGQPLQTRAEAARLDNTVQKLRLQRAQSLYRAAILEQKLAAENASAEQKELLEARVAAAQADVALAEHEADLAVLRLPFAGEVLRFFVSEGQFVRAGDPVAIVGDTSKLQVEVPAERRQVANAKTFPIKIEGEEVDAEIQTVMPLDPKFDSLRELFDSIVSAVVVIDNAKRRFQPGQTVFVPLIPRHPVAEVPSSSVGNRPDGSRKVQVLRNDVVRDVPVVLMGSIGSDRLFVSGPFAQGDEVIYESSHQLADGFSVRTAAAKPKKGESGSTSPSGAEPKKPAKPATDF